MGILEKFRNRFRKKKEVVELPQIIENKYCKSEDHFEYMYAPSSDPTRLSGYIFFDIIDSVKIDDKFLYNCRLRYGHKGKPLVSDSFDNELLGYDKVIVGLNKYSMNNDEKYAEYVLTELLKKERILDLYNIEFDKKEGTKSGNYIGTVVSGENGLSTLMDEEVMKKVSESSETAAIHANVKKYYDDLNAIYKKQDEEYRAKRIPQIDERIEQLIEEKDSLKNREEEGKTRSM